MSTMIVLFQIITLVFIIMKSTKCSVVIDALTQDVIYVSKYCPTQKYCREGTHVMCMYYDYNRKLGPRCNNHVKTKMTPSIATKILDDINNVRSKIATGVETGKDGESLPKGYGMMRLSWDSELATFAQVLANQCLGGKEDLCRATDRFPNPSQSIAIIQFTYPDWDYIRSNVTSSEGLNEEKLLFTIDRFVKTARSLKKYLSKDVVMNCPPFYDLPDQNLVYYLNLIRGGATHIGCGMSAYSRYNDDGAKQSIYNSVQVVCNISDSPEADQPVYNTEPPSPALGYSKRCGCPRGYKETRSCLCEEDIEDDNLIWSSAAPATAPPPTYDSSEIQPNFKYIKQRVPLIKKTERQRPTDMVSNTPLRDSSIKLSSEKPPVITKLNDSCTAAMSSCEMKIMVLPILSIKNAPPSKMAARSNQRFKYANTTKQRTHNDQTVEKIEYSDETFKEISNAFKKIPSRAYLKPSYDIKPKQIDHKSEPRNSRISVSANEDVIFKEAFKERDLTTERPFNNVDENVLDHIPNSNQNNDVDDNIDETVPASIENKGDDNKILTLLNILEKEVKKSKLDGELKDLFDYKMKHIYGSAIDIPDNIPNQEDNVAVEAETEDNINKIQSFFKKTHNIEAVRAAKRDKNDEDNDIHNDDYEEMKYEGVVTKKPANVINIQYDENITEPNNNLNWYFKRQGSKIIKNRKYETLLDNKSSFDRQYDDVDEGHDAIAPRDQELIAHPNVSKEKKRILPKTFANKNVKSVDDTVYDLDSNDIRQILEYRRRQKDRNLRRRINEKNLRLDTDDNMKHNERRVLNHPLRAHSRHFNKNHHGMRQMRRLRPNFEDDNMSVRSRHPGRRHQAYLTDREAYTY